MHARTGVDLRLAVVRQVIDEARHQRMRHQAGGGLALVHDLGRHRLLHQRLAAAESPLAAHVPVHDELRRNDVEPLAHVLAHALHQRTALAGGGGWLVVVLDAAQVVGQLLAARLADPSIEIVEDTSPALLAQVDAGRLDLAICRTTVSRSPQLYDSVKLQDETLAVIANVRHPLRNAKKLKLQQLADSRWVVYRANMPMRLLLEREFHDAGQRFPQNLLETTSAFATLALLQANPFFVALVSIEVAQFFAHQKMTCILPLALHQLCVAMQQDGVKAEQEGWL